MSPERMGAAEVRVFMAASDSDLPLYVGAFAEVRTDDRVQVLRTLGGDGWYPVDRTAEELRNRDFTLVFETDRHGLDDVDPIAAPALQRHLEQLAAAERIARAAHAGQTDKNGDPYIEHPRRVAARVDGLQERTVAWLHDVLEDTEVRTSDLMEEGFDLDVVNAVLALTRREGEPEAAYYWLIRNDPIALAVKLADLADNTDPARTARLDPAVRDRLAQKYEHARRALSAPEEQA